MIARSRCTPTWPPALLAAVTLALGVYLAVANTLPVEAAGSTCIWLSPGGPGPMSQWSNAVNWTCGGMPPGMAVPTNGDIVHFNSATGLTTMDITGLNLQALVFDPGAQTIVALQSPLTVGTVTDHSGVNTLTGPGDLTLSSVGPSVTFQVDTGQLSISTRLSGPSGLLKTGAGTLYLAASTANAYTGTTTVAEGVLLLNKPAGIAAVPGDLTVGDGNGAASSAAVRHLAANQLPDSATVALKGDGVLDLNGFADTIGPLGFTGGNVATGAGTLALSGDVSTMPYSTTAMITATTSGGLDLGGAVRVFDIASGAAPALDITAVITNGGLDKRGDGVLRLSGANLYGGETILNAGTLELYGSNPSSSVRLNGGTLATGPSTVQTGPLDASLATNTRLEIGGAGAGILSAQGAVQLGTGVTTTVHLNGTAPGSGYDQLQATGQIALGGATLEVQAGSAFPMSTEFQLAGSAEAVTGSFANGAVVVAAGSGQSFTIAVRDNWVVLTAQGSHWLCLPLILRQ